MIKSLAILCTLAAAMAPAAVAQRSLPVSVDASLGLRMGSGGSYADRGGAAADLLVGMPVGRTGAGTIIAALTAGAQAPMGGDLECLLDRATGTCAPDFPVLLSAGALVGVARPGAWGSTTRVLAGPAYFRGEHEGRGLGVQGRVDVATPAVLHTSLVLSLRGALIPRFQGETLGTTSLGLGLRIQ